MIPTLALTSPFARSQQRWRELLSRVAANSLSGIEVSEHWPPRFATRAPGGLARRTGSRAPQLFGAPLAIQDRI
jgi:hypothetical protein